MLGILVLGGWLAHLLMKVIELRRIEPTVSLFNYLRGHPYVVAYSAIASAVAGVAIFHYGELTPLMAVGVGYMSDSIMDKITSRTELAVR